MDNFFRELTAAEVAELSAHKVCRHYRKGDVIFAEGQRSGGLYCVSAGKIKLFKTGPEGRDQIVRLAGTGDVIGYRALISHEPYYATAAALEDCAVCLIPPADFFAFVEKNQHFSMGLIQTLSRDLRRAEERMLNLAQKSVRERLADTLMLLRDTYGYTSAEEMILNVTLSREDYASLVGTATETVIRLISDFRMERLIETPGKRMKILNEHALRQIAGN
jgi:CRP-like cAMP-binding protein